MSEAGTVQCLVEYDEDGVIEASRRALTVARQLAESASWRLDAVLVGPMNETAHATLGDFGVTRVHLVTIDGLVTFAPLAWAHALLGIESLAASRVIVAAGSERGNEVLAHVGALTCRPMVANCLSAYVVDSTISISRQRWAGSLIEDAELDVSELGLLSVAFDGVVAEPSPTSSEVALQEVTLELDDDLVGVRVSSWTKRQGGVDLAGARVVVGGGRGVGSAENFSSLDELAELLGAAVGVSRVVTSNGWRSHAQQVGQTGTRIAPELYLAAGISGATQHLAGCQSAKVMIAINTDADAPIIARADYAVIGDLNAIVPALVEAIRAR